MTRSWPAAGDRFSNVASLCKYVLVFRPLFIYKTQVEMATLLTGRNDGTVTKPVRSRRGSDAGLPPATVVTGSGVIASSRRNCLVGGFPGPNARPSVLFSTQKLSVTVGGCAAFYSVALSCAPQHPVTLSLANVPACLCVSPPLVVFSRANWRAPQFFRVAVLTTVYDDSNKDDRKLQVLEHESSSEDVRFSGNRVLFLPCNVLVQVSGREGCYLHSSGSTIGTATTTMTSVLWPTLGEFAQVDLELPAPTATPSSTMHSTRERMDSASIVSTQPYAGSRDSVASLSAAETVVKRVTSPRRTVLSVSASSASVALGIQSNSDAYYGAAPRDGVTTVKVVARAHHTAVLFKSGKWGLLGKMDVDHTSEDLDNDTVGGNGSRGSNAALSNMLVDIASGDAHVVALTEHGYVMTWGDGSHGRLGHGSLGNVRAPHAIKSLFHKRIVDIACGAQHTVAAADDGDVYSWGYGKCGALGHGRSEQDQVFDSVSMPMEVLSLKSQRVVRIACGDTHSAVVLQTGALLTCGWAAHGRLGRSVENEFSSSFARVTGGAMKTRRCTFVACGGAHTLALTDCKSLLAFGWNSTGQLGLGDRRDRTLPVKVQYFDADELVLTSVSAGKLHSLALTQDARVFAWGSDELGQCGVGSFPQLYTVPHLVASTVGLNVTQVSAGESHSVALSTTSQKQLDAMQSHYPTRYATLEESFQQFVQRDLEQHTRVLKFAKQEQLQREFDARQRKPPTDPSWSLARTLQRQCRVERDLAARLGASRPDALNRLSQGSTSASSCRPRTANAVLRSPTKGEGVDQDAERLNVLSTPPAHAVGCSSAILWRQTRLFSFHHQQQQQNRRRLTEKPPSSKPADLMKRRPVSASPVTSRRQSKLSAEARRSLAAMLDGDVRTKTVSVVAAANRNNMMENGDQETAEGGALNHSTSMLLERLASFPTSRPKSASSTARARK